MKIAGYVLVAFAMYMPCRYMWPLGASFYIDWTNHEWAIGYFGEYIRNNHAIPYVINTSGLGGLAHPVFYGNLMYPLLGMLASVLAPGVVIRIAAIAVFVAQYRLVSLALVRMQAPLYFARIVGCLVIWATYPLTNFYNRSALTEFFATTLLVCALGCLVLLFHADEARQRRYYAAGAMFSLTMAAGSHPITAMYAGPVFAALVPVFWWLLRHDRPRRRAILKSLAPWLAAAGVCILPWYLAAHRFAEDLLIRNTAREVSVLRWDTVQARFFPIPWDSAVTPGVSLDDIVTPYLDAQFSLSLLVVFITVGALAIAMAFRRKWSPTVAFAIGTVFFVVFLTLSLSVRAYHVFPAIAVMIQYAYRAITYINLSLLLGILLTVMALRSLGDVDIRRRLEHPLIAAAAVTALLLAATGVFVKWGHIAAIKKHESSRHWVLTAPEREKLIDLPAPYYGPYDYATDKLFAQVPASEEPKVIPQRFAVASHRWFGHTRPMKLVLAEPTWVMTNILVFPWSKIELDGAEVKDVRTHWGKLTVLVPAGEHRLTTHFRPPLLFRILRPLSMFVMFAWCGYLLAPAFAWGYRAIRSLVGRLRAG